MNTFYRVSLLLGLLLCVYSLSAQQLGTYDLTGDIDRLNARIAKQLKKSRCEKHSDFRVAHILLMVGSKDKDIISKEVFLSDSLIYKLEPSYIKVKSKEYIQTFGLIYDNNERLFALSTGRELYCLKEGSSWDGSMNLLLKYILDEQNSVKFLMMMQRTLLNVYLVVNNDNTVKVVKITDDGIKEYLREDFFSEENGSFMYSDKEEL